MYSSSQSKYTSNQKKINIKKSNQNSSNQYKEKENNYSKEINNLNRNANKSNLTKAESYSFDKSIKIPRIEYEKLSKKSEAFNEESENFNVYFMKPDLKSKTLSTTKKIKPKLFKKNTELKKEITYNENEDDDNPYKENCLNNNNEPQFQENDSEKMPLEIVHENNERIFKAHLVQKLKSFKLKQDENRKIPLNLKSKIKRDESFRNSMKHLLMKQSEKKDMKKELLYYKGYFRFWKKKSKIIDEQKIKKRMIFRIKKDRNIRITTVVYRAEIPRRKKIKNKEIEEKKIQQHYEKNEIFRQNLIHNLEQRKKNILPKSSINQSNDRFNNNIKNSNNNSQKKFEEEKISDFVKLIPRKEENEEKKISNNIYDENKRQNNKEIKEIDINNANEGLEKLNNIYMKKEEKKALDELKLNQNINKKKEALKKINNIFEKANEREGFESLKKIRNNSRKKEGTQKLNKVIEKKYSKSIITELKKNQNKSKISEAFNLINNLIKIKVKEQKINSIKQIQRYCNEINKSKINILSNEKKELINNEMKASNDIEIKNGIENNFKNMEDKNINRNPDNINVKNEREDIYNSVELEKINNNEYF